VWSGLADRQRRARNATENRWNGAAVRPGLSASGRCPVATTSFLTDPVRLDVSYARRQTFWLISRFITAIGVILLPMETGALLSQEPCQRERQGQGHQRTSHFPVAVFNDSPLKPGLIDRPRIRRKAALERRSPRCSD